MQIKYQNTISPPTTMIKSFSKKITEFYGEIYLQNLNNTLMYRFKRFYPDC